MIISFAVQNFRSIRERREISMLKTGLSGSQSNYVKTSTKKQVLKTAVIYGPNASGKSNFIKAIQALEYLVLRSSSYKLDASIEPYEPFQLDRSCLSLPVNFEISFIYEKLQYDYLVAFTDKRIEREELYFYPTNSKSLLYCRIADNEMKFGDYYKGVKKTLEKMLLPNQLFLSKASENNVDVLNPAYAFFKNGLQAFATFEDYHENNFARLYAKRLAKDSNSQFSKRFNALICSLDTGIISVSARETEWGENALGSLPEEVKNKIKEDYKYEIRTQHPIYDGDKIVDKQTFDVNDESKGTQSLFAIAGLALDALDSGRVLVVDEFERSLHPDITKYFIQMFHNPEINRQDAQLIFATHDISQLSNEHFRRDQVWFTKKSMYGATDIVRCSDIPGLRLGTPVDKWYSSGRLGAVPLIDDRNFIMEMENHVEDEE